MKTSYARLRARIELVKSVRAQVDERTCTWCGKVHLERKPEWEQR